MRIRSIKPEFFRSRTLNECSVSAQRTFIGLWCYADDEGRYRYEPALLKADVWPLDEKVRPAIIEGWVAELEAAGVLCRYEDAGRSYLHVVNWHEHQKVSRPSPSRLPECSRSLHGGVNADLGSRILDLGSGKGSGSNTVVDPEDRPGGDPDQVRVIFDAWVATLDPGTRRKLSPQRREKIRARLRTFPSDELVEAVQGWRHDPWPERPRHNDLLILLRTDEQAEKFRDLYRKGPPATAGPKTSQALETYRQMAAFAPPEEVNGSHDLGAMDRDRSQTERELPRAAS